MLPEPPSCGYGQSWSHAPSLCQMVLQMWSSSDGASALLMSASSSLPWHNALHYVGTPLCVPRLLSQPPDLHSSHVPARCHRCAAVAAPSRPPFPLFYPLHPGKAGTELAAVFCPPDVLARWVASARPWVGGRIGAGRGGSGRSGRGIKPGLFLYCKVITRAFQSLICREHPSAIGSLSQPGNNSRITRLLRQSPVNSYTWAHTEMRVLWSCQHVCFHPQHSSAQEQE